MKKSNKALQIRNYMNLHPTADTKKICSVLKVEPAYVYAIRNKMKSEAKNDNSTESVLKDFAERAYRAGAGRSSPQVGDNVGGLIRWRFAEPKTRMQSTEDKEWQPPELLPMPDVRVVDNVNHPPHYKTGGMETIDFIEAKELDYNLGNVVKYVTRAKHKGTELEDLKKAQWYLERAIMKLHV